MSIDEETLLAFLDGELDPEEAREVEAAIASDPALAERARAHAELRDLVASAYAPLAEEPVPERLLRAVQGGAAEVADLDAARARRRPTRALAPGAAWAMAASLVIGLAAGVGLTRLQPQPLLAAGPEGLEAQGALARTLDRQLASQGPAGPVRIGLSFRATDGRFCRSFTASAARGLAGVACRGPSGWRFERAMAAAPEPRTSAYRTAATETPPEVLDKIQSMIAGAPLDAQEEAAAKARGWRR